MRYFSLFTKRFYTFVYAHRNSFLITESFL
nr:MAG TPA: hypothetical protein [Bacteriophage sp.]